MDLLALPSGSELSPASRRDVRSLWRVGASALNSNALEGRREKQSTHGLGSLSIWLPQHLAVVDTQGGVVLSGWAFHCHDCQTADGNRLWENKFLPLLVSPGTRKTLR